MENVYWEGRKMTVSVVMSVYNGTPYLMEQMDSLRNQTRKIDELIVLDDCSTDETVDMVEKYIKKYNLYNWILIKNEKNLGWKKNFYKGIYRAKGDIIFPCDQDDIWKVDKIEVMAGVMEDNPNIEVLGANMDVVYDNAFEESGGLKKKITNAIRIALDKRDMKRIIGKNSKVITQKQMDETFWRCVLGCVLAARRDFCEKIKKYWIEEMPHDNFLCFYSNCRNTLYNIDYRAITYRNHFGSASNPAKSTRESRIAEIVVERKIMCSIKDYVEEQCLNEEYQNILNKGIKWLDLRMLLVAHKNIFSAIKLIRYCDYYTHLRRYFSDLRYGILG